MSVNSIRVIQGQLSQNTANVAVLRAGSVVQARVLSHDSNDFYTISLAGQKINVKSETHLQIGSVISAKVVLKGESFLLSLINENADSGEILQKFSVQKELSPQLSLFLSSLGFEPNAESFKILQFMQQVGMKINVPQAKKSLKNAENNEEKAQLSLLLEEKGIRSSDERVNAIIGKKGDERRHNQEKKRENEKEARNEQLTRSNYDEKGQLSNSEKVFDEKLIPSTLVPITSPFIKSYFENVDSAAREKPLGFLSAFNTVLSKNGENVPLRHWIVLPFEWSFQNSYGNIKLLFTSNLENLEKVIIDLKNAEKNNIFVLYFKNQKVDSVKFAQDSLVPVAEKLRLCKMLSSLFGNGVRVEMANFTDLRGFCSSDEEISVVSGKI